MKINITININFSPEKNNKQLEKLTMKIAEAIEIIKEAKTQLAKAKEEILAKIGKLENADGELTEEQSDAVDELRGVAQGLDDVVPDTV